MNQEWYCGHKSQLRGIEEHRLVGGKGDGMRLLEVRNGQGLEFTVSADRCADISRLSYRGNNFSYVSVDGYVGPAYYNPKGSEWLRSFTAGFLTTCGLTAVGDAEVCDGEELPLHGRIANQPAEELAWFEEDGQLVIRAEIPHVQALGNKLWMKRVYRISTTENTFTVTDTVRNLDARVSPFMILYHMNMGYPLLSEEAELYIPSVKVEARSEFAKAGIGEWNRIIPPQPGIEEQCYYHTFDRKGLAAIFNPAIGAGAAISFNAEELDFFTQWKMMGVRDYVLGLEPGNCSPDGRTVMRDSGRLKYLQPEEEKTYSVTVRILENREAFEKLKAGERI